MKYSILLVLLHICIIAISQPFNKIDSLRLFNIDQLQEKIQNLEVLESITDTLTDEFLFYNRFWMFGENVDTVSETISLELYLSHWDFSYDIDIWYRNSFMIELTQFDSLYVERKQTNRIDTFYNHAIEFVVNPENKENLPQKKQHVLPFFDTVELSKQGFYINAVMLPDSNGNKTSFKNLDSAFELVFQTYIDLREELAKNTWSESFFDLEFEKKVAITQYFPIQLWVYPNRYRVKPPPPPEPSEINLDSLFYEEE